MSPEQARGQRDDERSDLYSLGVVLYEALSGRLPFEAENFHALLFAIVSDPPVPLGSLRSDLPPQLLSAIERAMHKDPAARFATAREFADQLSPHAEATIGDLFASTTSPTGTRAVSTHEATRRASTAATQGLLDTVAALSSPSVDDDGRSPLAFTRVHGRSRAGGDSHGDDQGQVDGEFPEALVADPASPATRLESDRSMPSPGDRPAGGPALAGAPSFLSAPGGPPRATPGFATPTEVLLVGDPDAAALAALQRTLGHLGARLTHRYRTLPSDVALLRFLTQPRAPHHVLVYGSAPVAREATARLHRIVDSGQVGLRALVVVAPGPQANIDAERLRKELRHALGPATVLALSQADLVDARMHAGLGVHLRG
jgi:hypothetical protein